ncbi:TPA: hypothetical protein QHO27_004403 [Klebsiella pneumoniae subsp. pneumoniae]|jgi:hypothetical protein|uniref:hypothetical protein n=1 Tax=Phytobacter diazotrophicus TaxID=395631 RepID=UPI000CD30DC3|nr:hypothetical protein [Phytobacter diazotrophicus]AUV04984.1 hypothetical protein C2U52_01145 [Enterobacteriaceae bacterium ENNIH2]MDV2903572.1 hypothetical protein [Phytobacter diazotrophicus]RDT52180.1 hypothetical protein DXF93_22860 [Escherichia coli]HDT2444678.1 hypothetical protein [Klebsiella pneumoniae subsp. pneumoniae]
MANLTAVQVETDVDLLMSCLAANHREIPSAASLMKRSSALPLFAAMLSFFSCVIFYVSFHKEQSSVEGFLNFFTYQGWYLVAITTGIGLFVFLMTYNNQITYLSLPSDVRNKSLIVSHLGKIVRKSVITFCSLMIVSSLLSGISVWFALAVPALLLALFVVTSIVVSSEINRLGAGLALEKISSLIKKI